MLYLNGQAPDAVDQIMRYLDWKAVNLKHRASITKNKRESYGYYEAANEIEIAAKELRMALENAAAIAKVSGHD